MLHFGGGSPSHYAGAFNILKLAHIPKKKKKKKKGAK